MLTELWARSRPPAQLPFLLSLSLIAPACSAPHHHVALAEEVLSGVADRAATPAELELAFELARVAPLELEVPSPPATLDPEDDAFWQACAFTYNPDVRQARRKFLMQRALAQSAGKPGPIGLEVEGVDAGDAWEAEAKMTFDVIGILGLGPARAARELATEEQRLALAELESAVWSSRFRVDRARVRAAAALERERVLGALRREVEVDEPRIEVLARRGRIAASDLEWAAMVLRQLDQLTADWRAQRAEALAELAVAAGLPPDAPSLAAVSPAALAHWSQAGDPEPLPGARALYDRLPRLREMRMWCAIAEARLRTEVATRWPEIDLGPRAVFVPSEVLLGAVAQFAFPFFGSTDGRVDAALQECELMREALEDELLASLAALQSASVRAREARRALADTEPNVFAIEALWAAARARFATDTQLLGAWCMALERHVESTLALTDRAEQAALARLDLEESRGPHTRAEASGPAGAEPSAGPPSAAGGP